MMVSGPRQCFSGGVSDVPRGDSVPQRGGGRGGVAGRTRNRRPVRRGHRRPARGPGRGATRARRGGQGLLGSQRQAAAGARSGGRRRHHARARDRRPGADREARGRPGGHHPDPPARGRRVLPRRLVRAGPPPPRRASAAPTRAGREEGRVTGPALTGWWGVVLETPDPDRLAHFYADLLGWRVTGSKPNWATINQ